MSLPTIPGILITFGSAIIALLANKLKSDGLPERTNILIGGIAIVILAVAGVALTSGFTGDVQQNILLIAAVIFAFWQQFNTLLNQAQKSPSPLLPARPTMIPVPTQRASRAAGGPTSDGTV